MKYLVLGVLLLSGTAYAGYCNGHSNCTEVIVNKNECDISTADLVCMPTLSCDVDSIAQECIAQVNESGLAETIIQGVLQGLQLRNLNEPCEKCRTVVDCKKKVHKVHGALMQRCWVLAE